MRKTLFFDNTGPLLQYDGSSLWVDDLNPTSSLRWRMTRWELFRVGLRCLWAAVFAPKES